MRSFLGRFHRPMSRGLVNNMLTMNNLGDGSTLSLDFTAMGDVLDPRLTFSRASTATFVNSSGYVQFANANCFTYSNPRNLTTAWNATGTVTWNGTGGIADPIDGTNAQSITFGTAASAIFNTAGTIVTSGITHTFSVWLRAASGTTNARIGSSNTGAVSTVALTTTWQRFSCQYVTNGTNDGGAIYSQTVTATPEIYVWGAQVQPGSIVGDLIQTSGTQNYSTPRFDYSPTNIGEPRGLLVEGQAINLAYRSNDFAITPLDGNNWNSSGYTADFTSTSLPDGSTGNARRLSMASGSGSYRSSTITVTASTQYTFSFWARNNGGSQARYRVWNVTAGSSIVDYNLSGSNYVASIGGANNTSSTWVRISVTFTTPAGCTGIYIYPSSSDSGTVDLLVWGAQLELGSGASSYIPTGASQVTRNTDSCLMSGTNFSSWFNNTEGTCLFVGDNSFVPAASNFSTNWALISAANSMRINNYTRHTSGRLGASARDSGGTALTFDSPTASPTNITTTAVYKTAFALKTNDFAYSVNGNTVGLGDGNGVFETVTSIEFARDGIRNGHMKQFKYFPTRLSNAQLQTLTTP